MASSSISGPATPCHEDGIFNGGMDSGADAASTPERDIDSFRLFHATHDEDAARAVLHA